MAGKEKLIFDLKTEEKEWYLRLVEKSGEKYAITFFRKRLDEYAGKIGFPPRPK